MNKINTNPVLVFRNSQSKCFTYFKSEVVFMLINSIYLKAERILLEVTKIQVRCI